MINRLATIAITLILISTAGCGGLSQDPGPLELDIGNTEDVQRNFTITIQDENSDVVVDKTMTLNGSEYKNLTTLKDFPSQDVNITIKNRSGVLASGTYSILNDCHTQATITIDDNYSIAVGQGGCDGWF